MGTRETTEVSFQELDQGTEDMAEQLQDLARQAGTSGRLASTGSCRVKVPNMVGRSCDEIQENAPIEVGKSIVSSLDVETEAEREEG